MRILMVCSYLGENITGAEKFLLILSQKLSDEGHDLGVIAKFDNINSYKRKYKDIQFYEIKKDDNLVTRKVLTDYLNIRNIRPFIRILRGFSPDLVHFHNFYGIGSYLIRVSSEYAPTLLTTHDSTLGYFFALSEIVPPWWKRALALPINSYLQIFNRYNLKKATIVSQTDFIKSALEKQGFRVDYLVRNGIDMSKKSSECEKENIILSVGRLSRDKGLYDVAPILRKVAEKYEWEVDVLGDGEDLDFLKSEFPSFRYHGFTDPTNYYKRSSLFIIPSLVHENLPYVVLESFLFGAVVIGRKVGGIPEMITNKKNGFIFESNEDLERLLIEVVEQKYDLEKIRKNAQNSLNEYSWDKCLSKYNKIYQKI